MHLKTDKRREQRMKFFTLFLLIVFINSCMLTVKAQQLLDDKLSKQEILSSTESSKSFWDVDITGRKLNAVIYSALVPGSGQTYLGHELKGAAISVSFYAAAIAAVIAHNNFLAREDRIKVLTKSYTETREFTKADQLWRDILNEANNRKHDYDRRKIFSYAAAGLWLLNVFDIFFLSDDLGADVFSMKGDDNPLQLRLALDENFSGVALKLYLP